MSFDFTGITARQAALLTLKGWSPGCGRKQPNKGTVRKLVERGLVVEIPRRVGLATVMEYEVPIGVHAAWCLHCADQEAARK